MPTNGHEGHDMGKPEGVHAHPAPKTDSEHPGYETQDVNVGGVVYFLGGLVGSLVVFFVLCIYVGKAINVGLADSDGAPDRWHPYGATRNVNRQNLTPNPVTEQKELAAVTATFPTPRLVADDDNQETADLHAREDLLLENYTVQTDAKGTHLRIPIDHAMELIVQRGLGAAPAAKPGKTLMVGEETPVIHAPLTNGFARTGFELDTIQNRQQKNEYAQATAKKE